MTVGAASGIFTTVRRDEKRRKYARDAYRSDANSFVCRSRKNPQRKLFILMYITRANLHMYAHGCVRVRSRPYVTMKCLYKFQTNYNLYQNILNKIWLVIDIQIGRLLIIYIQSPDI